jgi:hypothetical protein
MKLIEKYTYDIKAEIPFNISKDFPKHFKSDFSSNYTPKALDLIKLLCLVQTIIK